MGNCCSSKRVSEKNSFLEMASKYSPDESCGGCCSSPGEAPVDADSNDPSESEESDNGDP